MWVSIDSKGYIGTGYATDDFKKDFWEYDPATDKWTQKADFGGSARWDAVGFSIDSKGYIGTGAVNHGNRNEFWEFIPAANAWTQKADFAGTARTGAVGFGIGSKGYIGTGAGGDYEKDFWEYDTSTGNWTQKADFAGTARAWAVGFSIGSKGYIGTGYSYVGTNEHYYKDFWEYDPAKNTWTQKADFGGTSRYQAVGFSIGSKGYLGTGVGSEYPYKYKDFWEYDPASNTWTQKADFGGTARGEAVGFSIGNKGYIGTGFNSNSRFGKDFWEYDPAASTWTQKANFGGTERSGAVGFSIGSKGYIGTGMDINYYTKDFQEYDPAANTWTPKADFGGTARREAVGFSIGTKGYIGTGDGTHGPYSKDFWEYTPGGCPAPSKLRVPKIADTAAVLKWTLPDDTVSYFHILYRAAGTSNVLKRVTKGTNKYVILKGLSPNTTYGWQIRSRCETDSSAWITGPNFTTTSSAVISSIAEAANNSKAEGNTSVQIMPNPNKGSFTLQMHLPGKAASTTLTLFNNLGAKIWEQKAGMLSGSLRRNIVLVNKLSTGVYLMVVQQNEFRLTQKVFVVK